MFLQNVVSFNISLVHQKKKRYYTLNKIYLGFFMPDILIISKKIERQVLKELAGKWFKDMIKYVVDVKREVIAIGGELYADAEEILIEDGSRQEDLWGANLYLWNEPAERIEYTALINIRPSHGNPGMEIMDGCVKEKIKIISETLLLESDEYVS